MGKMGSDRKTYPTFPSDYKVLEEVGFGASATVYRAICLPFNEIVAIKCLDLDRCASNLDEIRREAQTMSLIDHPNVIRAYCSFVVEQQLWVVMPFMSEGSCLHLMKISYPDGFEEDIIGSILKETLKALEYLHRHGHIHRDVKAGNILLDSNGIVKLGDFGVSACMFDNGDRQRARNTFTGTPCWMAPEVLQPGSGYDFKADIWSFGITALELAHGHAPFSKYPPMKVLLMTIQNAPPGLDYDRDKRFSKSFKEMVAMCLVKDQTKRPTVEKLLKHSFFKHAKPVELSVKYLLADLPPLWDRVKALQLKDAAQLALRRMPSAEEEAISQSEYKRGVSAWNFDVEDLKAQAALVQDDDDLTGVKKQDGGFTQSQNAKDAALSVPLVWNSMLVNEIDVRSINKSAKWPETKPFVVKEEIREADSLDFLNQDKPGKHSADELDDPATSASAKDLKHGFVKIEAAKNPQTHSGPLLPSNSLCHSFLETEPIYERWDGECQPANDKCRRFARKVTSFNGPLMLSNRASANSLSAPIKSSGGSRDSLEDKSKFNVVQVGRFSVTSGSVDLVKDIPPCAASRRSSQVSPLRKSASVGDWLDESRSVPNSQPPHEVSNCATPTSIIMPQLQNLVQQTAFQQDLILTLFNSLQQMEVVDVSQSGMFPSQTQNSEYEDLAEMGNTERERLLLNKISELQERMNSLTDELTAAKLKYMQLEKQLNTSYGQEEDSCRIGEKDS